jgi:hypothetical protein
MSVNQAKKRRVGQFVATIFTFPEITFQLKNAELVLQWFQNEEEYVDKSINQKFNLIMNKIVGNDTDSFQRTHEHAEATLISITLWWKDQIPYKFEIDGFFDTTGDDIKQKLKNTLETSKKTLGTFGMQAIVNFVNELDKMHDTDLKLTTIPLHIQDEWYITNAPDPKINSSDLRTWDSESIDTKSNRVSMYVKQRMEKLFKPGLSKHDDSYKTFMKNMKTGGFYGFAGFRPILETEPKHLYVENVGIIEHNIAEMSAAFADRCIV